MLTNIEHNYKINDRTSEKTCTLSRNILEIHVNTWGHICTIHMKPTLLRVLYELSRI